jgi:hypothetical protein
MLNFNGSYFYDRAFVFLPSLSTLMVYGIFKFMNFKLFFAITHIIDTIFSENIKRFRNQTKIIWDPST